MEGLIELVIIFKQQLNEKGLYNVAHSDIRKQLSSLTLPAQMHNCTTAQGNDAYFYLNMNASNTAKKKVQRTFNLTSAIVFHAD